MNSVMADRIKYSKNKNYMNHNSKHRNLLLIIIYTMAMINELHSSTLVAKLNNAICSNSSTCTKCLIKAQCAWSLQQQTCFKSTHSNLSSLVIYSKNNCPRFSVAKKYTYNNTSINLKYIVKVSNDDVGFMNYLQESIFFCNSTTIDVYKKIIINNKIICSANILTNNFKEHSTQSFTAFIYIKFNGVLLRLDNIADHYVTVYEHKCTEQDKDEFCATCTWNDNDYAHYVRLCSSENLCEGHNELYMWHNNKGKSWHSNTQKIKDQCAEINAIVVDPLSGTMFVGKSITIAVKNHLIFAENRKVMVTVAGMVCEDPWTSGPETITCIMSPPSKVTNKKLSGSVLIEYSSINSLLTIESSQIFQVCLNPVLDADQQLGGIASGGTSVPVRGGHFVKLCIASSARLYVDLPDGVRLYAEGYCDPPLNETYMVCRSPRIQYEAGLDENPSVVGRQLNVGLYITSLENVVRDSSLKFYVHPDPVLLDFEIDVNGLVVVNGLYLQYILQDEIAVRSVDSSSKVCIVILVTENSLVCEPTISVSVLQEISVSFGNSSVITVIRRTSPLHDYLSILLDWLLTIMFTVLMLVCAVILFIRKKH